MQPFKYEFNAATQRLRKASKIHSLAKNNTPVDIILPSTYALADMAGVPYMLEATNSFHGCDNSRVTHGECHHVPRRKNVDAIPLIFKRRFFQHRRFDFNRCNTCRFEFNCSSWRHDPNSQVNRFKTIEQW